MELAREISQLNLPKVKRSKGEILIKENEVLTEMYILLSGKVSIKIGDNHLVDVNEEGAFLGESSFILGVKATATVEVLEDIEVLVIEDAKKFLHEHADLWFRIAQVLARRIIQMNKTFVEVQRELEKHTGEKHGKLYEKFYRFMISTNDFFDRDVRHPLTETEEAKEHKVNNGL